jgi:hypothetical protein
MRKVREWISKLHKVYWVVFFMLSFLTICVFSVLSNVVLHRKGLIPSGFKIAVVQAEILGSVSGKVGYYIFLFMTWILLWGSQLSISEGIVRQIADTTYLVSKKIRKVVKKDIRKWYFSLFLLFTVWGMVWIILQMYFPGFIKPDTLLFLSANVSLVFQVASLPMILYFQYFIAKKNLPKELWEVYKPHPIRTVLFIVAMCFWGFFSAMAWKEILQTLIT